MLFGNVVAVSESSGAAERGRSTRQRPGPFPASGGVDSVIGPARREPLSSSARQRDCARARQNTALSLATVHH